METIINKRGGKREGSGRKATDRKNILFCRISDEAMSILQNHKNYSEFIDKLIKDSKKAE